MDNLLDLVADGVITAEDYKSKSEAIKIELTHEACTKYSNALDGMTEEKLLAIK